MVATNDLIHVCSINNKDNRKHHGITKQEFITEALNTDPLEPIDPRLWQNECREKLNDHRYKMVLATTGCGKSTCAIILECDKKHRKIIAVPQSAIGKGFSEACVIRLSSGTTHKWTVLDKNNLCKINANQTVREFKNFVKNALPKEVMVCTHATIALAFKSMKSKEFKRDWKNISVWIDEAHHVKYNEAIDLEVEEEYWEEDCLPDDQANSIGKFIRQIIKNDDPTNNIGLMTATYLRGDMESIISPEHYNLFEKFELPYDKHMATMKNLEEFRLSFMLSPMNYSSAIESCMSKWEKTIIFIPPRSPNGAYTKHSKSKEVKDILLSLAKSRGFKGKKADYKREGGIIRLNVGKGKTINVVDLVSSKRIQESGRKFYENHPEDIDIIIANKMANEGWNWIYCARVIIIGYRRSISLVLQKIGRMFRDIKGKKIIEAINVIPESYYDEDNEEASLNKFNDINNAYMAAMAYLEILQPPRMKENRRGVRKGLPKDKPLIELLIPQVEIREKFKSEVIDTLMVKDLLKKSAYENGDAKTSALTEKERREICDEVIERYIPDSSSGEKREIFKYLMAYIVRPQLQQLGLEYSFLRENGFAILEDMGIDPLSGLRSIVANHKGINHFALMRKIHSMGWLPYEIAEAFMHLFELKSWKELEDFRKNGIDISKYTEERQIEIKAFYDKIGQSDCYEKA